MPNRYLSIDLLCHSLHRTTFAGKYDGFTLVRKSFLDWDMTKEEMSLLFHLFGSFHSSTYITPDAPHGSVFVPLRFCLYLLPMSAMLKYHKFGYHFYVDDTQLYISFKCKQPFEAISKVNRCLSDIRRWMIMNKLKITDSKQFIVFRSSQLRCDLSGLSVNVGESQITPSLKVRDLGVTFDLVLNFDNHITAICRNTYFHIRNIGKTRNLLSYNTCSTIIHALISCRFDYCSSQLHNVPTNNTDRLQRLQNQCARIMTKSPRREHITPVIKKPTLAQNSG